MMTVTVDEQSQTIDNGKTVEFTLSGGDHTLTVSFGDSELTLTVEMDGSQHLEYAFNGRELSVDAKEL